MNAHGHDASADPTDRDTRLASGPPYADCVLCGEPTEYGAGHPGATLCPVCEWQEAERASCGG
ncbi:hypothetical protein [Streptomyces sp. NPDC048639]|uniref:hypothetical protein n=1 Tax=Streptomyces sp. NPDC048639 TaxID=3365581 RepID=UPI00371C2F7C